jgi:hypothetical protein
MAQATNAQQVPNFLKRQKEARHLKRHGKRRADRLREEQRSCEVAIERSAWHALEQRPDALARSHDRS